METRPTKQRILDEALNLFSVKGYEAVSVAEIAGAVGIKAPSLYKHFKSKKDIFRGIIEEMDRHYAEKAFSMNMNGTDEAADAGLFSHVDENTLVEMGKSLFLHFLHDEYTAKFRRMLIIEKFHSDELAELFVQQYADNPLTYQGMLIGMLSQTGFLKKENPQIMALHFYAPMFLLLTVCDCQPEREKEALETIELHIRQFNRLYQNGEEAL